MHEQNKFSNEKWIIKEPNGKHGPEENKQIKNVIVDFNTRCHQTEERICELEDRSLAL